MKRLTIAPLLLALGCATEEPPTAEEPEVVEEFLDPVVVDADHYRLEFENDYVRVLRENMTGGTEGAMHSHRDRVSVYLNDSEVTLVPRGGEPVSATLVAGSTSWGDAATHQGTPASDIENISIELKELGDEDVPQSGPDAVEVDPEHHVVDFENDRVRVVRMVYPPGFKTPFHGHRIGFGVFLSDALGRNFPAEGEPIPIEAKARSTFWLAGLPAHVTENLSDEDLVAILVEMKKHPAR